MLRADDQAQGSSTETAILSVRSPPVSPSRKAAIEDAELVRRFRAGDESAFGEIANRHRMRLFCIAFDVLKNRGDAEEIVQDVLIGAYRSLGGFRGDSSLATWLHCIALNLSRNRYWYFFRRRRHRSISLDSQLGECGRTISDLVPSDAVGPPREVSMTEFAELIRLCLPRLLAHHREILAMHFTARHSYANIAVHFNISIGTVKSRLARARENLRALMEEECPESHLCKNHMEWFDLERPASGAELHRV